MAELTLTNRALPELRRGSTKKEKHIFQLILNRQKPLLFPSRTRHADIWQQVRLALAHLAWAVAQGHKAQSPLRAPLHCTGAPAPSWSQTGCLNPPQAAPASSKFPQQLGTELLPFASSYPNTHLLPWTNTILCRPPTPFLGASISAASFHPAPVGIAALPPPAAPCFSMTPALVL